MILFPAIDLIGGKVVRLERGDRSRCKGYYCYCADHINNHTHIQ